MSSKVRHTGISRSVYPEQLPWRPGWLERWGRAVVGPATRQVRMRRLRLQQLVQAVHGHAATMAPMQLPAIKAMADNLRQRLRLAGWQRDVVAQTFALVREVAGQTLGMRHYDGQLMGGWVLLHGMIAEMETGEGKTLTATLPACTAALTGLPVHIITVNDYLARRDAEWMQPVYQALGLTVGVITQGMELPRDVRRMPVM